MIESLRKLSKAYGHELTITTKQGKEMTLGDVAEQIAEGMMSIFVRKDGKRPLYGNIDKFQNDPLWRDYIFFHEYFHGDTGVGLGLRIRPAGPAWRRL
jgi:hypothetical protein